MATRLQSDGRDSQACGDKPDVRSCRLCFNQKLTSGPSAKVEVPCIEAIVVSAAFGGCDPAVTSPLWAAKAA